MTQLEKPKNQWAKALYILYDSWYAGVSMANILTQYDHTFYKFQSRLGELEKAHAKLKVSRVSIPYVSKIDSKSKHYTQYTLISPKPYIVNLYNLINEKGLVNSISESSSKAA